MVRKLPSPELGWLGSFCERGAVWKVCTKRQWMEISLTPSTSNSQPIDSLLSSLHHRIGKSTPLRLDEQRSTARTHTYTHLRRCGGGRPSACQSCGPTLRPRREQCKRRKSLRAIQVLLLLLLRSTCTINGTQSDINDGCGRTSHRPKSCRLFLFFV